jgi:protein-tyrosine-phosphatase
MTKPDATRPVRVLFLCTHNAARSQIAEALLARKGRGRFDVSSAGTEPARHLHPLTVVTLRRAGIEWEGRPICALPDEKLREVGLEAAMREIGAASDAPRTMEP